MAITKTNFINYTRCPRYIALEDIKKETLVSSISLEEYRKQEEWEDLNEITSLMIDENGEDLIDTKNEQMEIMLPFYRHVELLAGKIAHQYFDGSFVYSKDTAHQESFDTLIDGIRYLCYVDIYNEVKNTFRIIEVKATTSNQYLSLGSKDHSIFQKKVDGTYALLEDLNMDIAEWMSPNIYERERAKLLDRYTSVGHYVYDLAVQRYIIEHDLMEHGQADKIPTIRYYLAVLNHRYVLPKEDGIPTYPKDVNGNDVILYLDMTSVTKDMQDKIDQDRKRIEQYLQVLNQNPYPIGLYCEKKKTTKCKFIPVCWNIVPEQNSLFAYLDNHFGFKDPNGVKHTTFELINDGYVKMTDLPETYLTREKNKIQRNVVMNHKPYINRKKIADGICNIHYPIYHLDFETFNSPLPRFYGESPYTQSVFQFSLHIEKEPGVCDKEQDHYGYLAPDHLDHRLDLVQKLCEWIDTDHGGTILVYNESFEKTRLKELANIFPEYRTKLLKMRDMIFDLMYVIRGNTKLYEALGYSSEEVKQFNYYHEYMNGSFSIKKILPLFSNLTYQGMEVSNGTEAMVTYASFPKLEPKIYEYKYQKLVEYCKQDTWAMVEILAGLRELGDD